MTGNEEAQAQAIRNLAAAQSFGQIREVVTHAARDLLQADGVTFVLREGELCYYAEEDAIAPLWKGRRFPMAACISGWAMRERKSVTIKDIYTDCRIPHDAYEPTFVRSLAMVPLDQDEPIAAMGAYWSRKRNISTSELRILQCFANVAGLTISHIELKRAKQCLQVQEMKRQLMLSELRHRFQNQLSVILAIFRQTLRSTRCLKELDQAFCGRLQALARAQELLTSPEAGALGLRTILREQMAAIGGASRVTFRGPDVVLPHGAALDLSLVIYELTTNASKHGALSSEAGQIRVEWIVDEIEGSSKLGLRWSEENGPPVVTPQKTGFGSQLICHALQSQGGNAELRYEPTGLVCQISLPLE
jgi:two-component sensor histidine kinase